MVKFKQLPSNFHTLPPPVIDGEIWNNVCKTLAGGDWNEKISIQRIQRILIRGMGSPVTVTVPENLGRHNDGILLLQLQGQTFVCRRVNGDAGIANEFSNGKRYLRAIATHLPEVQTIQPVHMYVYGNSTIMISPVATTVWSMLANESEEFVKVVHRCR